MNIEIKEILARSQVEDVEIWKEMANCDWELWMTELRRFLALHYAIPKDKLKDTGKMFHSIEKTL